MPTRRRSGSTHAPSPTTRWPPMSTVPESGTSNPATTLSTVVFPDPLGPSNATTSPSTRDTDAPATARVSPNDLSMPVASIANRSVTWASI